MAQQWEQILRPTTGQAPGNATVTTTTAELIPANTQRRWITMQNLGAANVFIAIGHPAEVNKGSVIYPGSFYQVARENGSYEAINAITPSGTALVIFQEFTDDTLSG